MDYLAAVRVYFVDEDVIILAFNGLPAEYNTLYVWSGCVRVSLLLKILGLSYLQNRLLWKVLPLHHLRLQWLQILIHLLLKDYLFPFSQSYFISQGLKPYNGNKKMAKVDLIKVLDLLLVYRCILLIHMFFLHLIQECLVNHQRNIMEALLPLCGTMIFHSRIRLIQILLPQKSNNGVNMSKYS